MNVKRCRTCGLDLPVDQFYRAESRCKPCCVARSTEYSRRRKFGVSGDEYGDRLRAQGEACVVCLGHSGSTRQLAVDHDHATGQVRGLLCVKCNTALGSLDEDTERMERLIDYIKTWSAA